MSQLEDSDDLDALCEIVDALAEHVATLTKDRQEVFQPGDIGRIESIADRARRLYSKRMHDTDDDTDDAT